eukprot:6213639-Pleurochrysis_carterae.AAC.4
MQGKTTGEWPHDPQGRQAAMSSTAFMACSTKQKKPSCMQASNGRWTDLLKGINICAACKRHLVKTGPKEVARQVRFKQADAFRRHGDVPANERDTGTQPSVRLEHNLPHAVHLRDVLSADLSSRVGMRPDRVPLRAPRATSCLAHTQLIPMAVGRPAADLARR